MYSFDTSTSELFMQYGLLLTAFNPDVRRRLDRNSFTLMPVNPPLLRQGGVFRLPLFVVPPSWRRPTAAAVRVSGVW